MADKEQRIDRTKLKDPSTVSGWGRDRLGHNKQEWSDIDKGTPVKPEFEQGHATKDGRGDGRNHS